MNIVIQFLFFINRDMQVIQTFTEDPWMDDDDKKTAGWCYPYQDPLSRCRMFTFKDLWNNNYFVSEGSKFGGDFLVYCGDPVKYHAKYIVICVQSRSVVVASDWLISVNTGF